MKWVFTRHVQDFKGTNQYDFQQVTNKEDSFQSIFANKEKFHHVVHICSRLDQYELEFLRSNSFFKSPTLERMKFLIFSSFFFCLMKISIVTIEQTTDPIKRKEKCYQHF